MAWDESKHPRDGDGRFSENQHERDEKKRDAVRHIYDSDGGRVRIPLDFFAEKKDYSNEPIPDVQEAHDFGRIDTKHHERHVWELGYKDEKQYKLAAVNFFNEGEGTLYYSKRRKRFYLYDQKTNKLAVSSEGIIHTFMKKTPSKFNDLIKLDVLVEVKK
jgi:pyocin large subunit-like protein